MSGLERKTVMEWQREGVLRVEDGNHGENRPRKDEFADSGMAFIRAADMKDGMILFDRAEKIDERGQARVRKGIGQPGDILISHKGTIGRVARTPLECPAFVCSPQTTFWRVENEERLDRNYLFALLRSPGFQAEFAVRSGETDMAGYVSLTSQRALEVSLPPIEIQSEIAAIIGALDNKIELNLKAAVTLEEMARALYRSWFVDFDPVWAKVEGRKPAHMDGETAALFPDSFGEDGLPEGWVIQGLGDLLKLNYGKALKKDLRVPGEFPVYGSGGTDSTHITALVEHPTVIVGRKGTVGSLHWAPNGCWPIDTVFFVTTEFPITFILRLLETLPLSDMNTDAAVPGLNRDNAYRLEIPFSGQPLITAFAELSKTWQRKIDHITVENRGLSTLRDTLLPRLMSGELRVDEAQEQVEECIST